MKKLEQQYDALQLRKIESDNRCEFLHNQYKSAKNTEDKTFIKGLLSQCFKHHLKLSEAQHKIIAKMSKP